jgi:hypothetical protein
MQYEQYRLGLLNVEWFLSVSYFWELSRKSIGGAEENQEGTTDYTSEALLLHQNSSSL